MLFYKSWLESRLRFWLSLAGLVLFAAFYAFVTERHGPLDSKDFHFLLFVGHEYLVGLWILAIVLLGMGGLLREKATGISQFTLALPASRIHLVAVRFGVYLAEAITLGIASWSTLLLVTHLMGRPWVFREACFFDALLIGGGLVFIGLATLVSSFIEGEYTTPVVAFGLIMVIQMLCNSVSWLKPLNFWRLQGGFNYVDPKTWLIVMPFPWVEVFLSLLFLILMLTVSMIAIQRREF